MKSVKVHLMDLVRRHDATGAVWALINDPDHVTPNTKCWQVTLLDALIPAGRYGHRRVAAHTFNIANGVELVTDEYIAWQVLKRLEQAS